MGLIPAKSPFQPILPGIADFTLNVTDLVGTSPSALAVDAGSNIWVANNGSDSVTKLNRQGSASTYNAGAIAGPTGIAIDTSGNVWVANAKDTITELDSTGTNIAGSPFSGGGLSRPTAIAIDGLGNIWVANGAATTTSVFTSSGIAVTGTSGYISASSTGTGEVAVAVSPH